VNTWGQVATWVDRGSESLHRWDQETLQAISESPFLTRLAPLFLAATYLGDGYLWGGLALGLIFFGRPIDHAYVLSAVAISAVNIVVFRVFKLLFRRERPTLVFFTLRSRLIDSHSFPSGHATTTFGLVWIIVDAYPYLAVQLGAYLVAILIGLSRIYLKEHYPLDVIGGALLGSAISACLLPLLKRMLF
jgi:undecaprenyl-diphosphatase